ncbi:DUF2971 domain-containing protein [Vibrio owensii]|uniref:DUF2971 domain-containing protein n=1 Tax=Vibrio owensii TaxID=696485 RepID=A0ABN5Q231_9VIBR|nr:DUF2971 domain-containing protein [Vibrio owensii]AYO13887.1 DUF2971 domain-containing protein [Vibrio owensii]MDF4339396.1 DUF2971 domain-containing protein [Vibrio parahaemolyticus]CAH1533012.1 conserved hypothetical protein [Vibrio jasicida]
MSNIDDKKIISWIKNQEFSKLTFLDNCWQSDENEWYLGFYYFIQYLKQECLDDVIAEVTSRHSDESSAYCYLGDTANKIYSSFNEQHIPACFYRYAIKLNPNNAHAHWGLFITDDDTNSCITSLKLDYENNEFEKLGRTIDNLFYRRKHFSNFTLQDWHFIKSLIQDSKITCRRDMLVFALFYLDEVEDCLALIESIETVSVEIIEEYFDRGLISKDFALSKLSFWQVDKFLGDDNKAIYQAYIKESEKGEANPTRRILIQKAFLASEYKDVVTYYEEAPTDDLHNRLDIDVCLYYLLALSYLKQPVNKQILEFINNKADTLRDESKILYQAVRCKHKIDELERLFQKETHFNDTIERWGIHQEVIEAFDSPDLIKHQTYEHLSSELESLTTKWNDAYYDTQLAEIKVKLSNGDMSSDDFLRLYHLGIECNEFDFVIENVTKFHAANQPTMSSYNCIGVCHERKKELRHAFEYYKLAIELMRSSKDYNHIIIGNYISCAERLPDVEIAEEEYIELRHWFNADLVNQFKWHTFTAKSGRLFKYSPFNINSIDALTNQYFYLASKKQLNDPIELPTLSKLDSNSLIDTNYRICSLSSNNNSMLMWSHYAQEHQGIMVEYWFGGEFPCGVGIEKVSYVDESKRNLEKDLVPFNQYLLTKNNDWAYEDEVRIFTNVKEKINFESFEYPNADRTKINARICSITLGCDFPDDKRKLIANIANTINSKRESHVPKVTLREAFISQDNCFALEYRDIDISKI